MLDRARIAALIPHQGAMCLLDALVRWSQSDIVCTARSHLDRANPLRRDGLLAAVCGIEYAMQAAALHGALRDGAPQRPGYVASARDVALSVARLDDPDIGVLQVEADLLQADAAALLYGFRLLSAQGGELLRGRATIALPPRAADGA